MFNSSISSTTPLQAVHGPCCAQLWVLHMSTLKKTLVPIAFTVHNTAKYSSEAELLEKMQGCAFLYSARVERSFLVGFLTDCLMLLDFFSLVGGILGD